MIQALREASRRIKPRTEIEVFDRDEYVYDGEIGTYIVDHMPGEAQDHLPGDDTVIIRGYGWMGRKYEMYFKFDREENTVYLPVEMSDNRVVMSVSEQLVDTGFNIDYVAYTA